jgi:hypothetical protein
MEIDARDGTLDDLFHRLKDHLACHIGREVDVVIFVTTASDAKKVETFVSMSGCSSKIEKREDHYRLHVTGSPCCA